MSRRPVVVLGVDAGSPALVDRWTATGDLPVLAGLMQRGCRASIRGIEGFFVGSTWPSFYTATSPARHGLHYLRQLRTGTYDLYDPRERGLVQAQPFWKPLHRAGRRIALLDVPLTVPEPGGDGIQIVEWGGHDAIYGFHTWPESLASRVRNTHGMHPLTYPCDQVERTPQGYRRFLDALIAGVERKASLTEDLYGSGGWDLFMQVFTEAHCAGHQCWHLHDPGHPAYDPELSATLGDPLLRVYRAIDTAIGRLLPRFEGCQVFVFSAHGMSHWYGAQFLLPEILARLGVTTPPPHGPVRGSAIIRLARRGWHAIPTSARNLMTPLKRRWWDRRTSQGSIRLVGDPATSSCFLHPNGLAVGGIRLNLRGREPAGVLAAGVEADRFAEELAIRLLAIVDDRTSRPVIRRVLHRRDLYDGPCADDLPDLLVEWDDTVPTGSAGLAGGTGSVVRLRSPDLGILEGRNEYGRSGEHRAGGVCVTTGPGIPPGGRVEGVRLVDLAPTLCQLLDVPLTDVDGRVVPALMPNA